LHHCQHALQVGGCVRRVQRDDPVELFNRLVVVCAAQVLVSLEIGRDGRQPAGFPEASSSGLPRSDCGVR
jgi:hypothetical protein